MLKHIIFYLSVFLMVCSVSSCGKIHIQNNITYEEYEEKEEYMGDEVIDENTECIGKHYRIQVNGTSIYYEVAGQGKPIILVSANGGDHTNLSKETKQLVQAGYKVYAVDSRGQGKNEALNEYHYNDMAEDIYQFILKKQLDKPAYYGWSDGGNIGLLLELTHPDELSCMIISGANLNPNGVDYENGTVKWVAELAECGDPLSVLLFEEPDIDPNELKKITIPVMVTAGENDLILEEHTKMIAENLPNAELKIIPGHDHEEYIVDCEIMGDLIIDFLKRNEY